MSSFRTRSTGTSRWSVLLLFLGVTFVAAWIGTAATLPSIPTWYADLTKPAWTPPDSVFGPVWTLLYLMMALAAWLVWRRAGWERGRGALTLWFLQLALNALWSVLFFALQWVGPAMAEIVVLWLAIAATIVAFARHSGTAAALLVPYLLWVSYAATLNGGVWWLNP